MKLCLIGDPHGNIGRLQSVLNYDGIQKADKRILLGDIGYGFDNTLDAQLNKLLSETNTHFIHGNHDNYDVLKSHPNFLGRFSFDEQLGILFISGEHSIDKSLRVPFIDWWPTEQLNIREADECIELVRHNKDKIKYIVSHGCPKSIIPHMIPKNAPLLGTSLTAFLLESIKEIVKPKEWIFGHYHKNRRIIVDGTKFVCVDILSQYYLEI